MLKKLNGHHNFHILIVLDKRRKAFIAHCLDMDIVAQGKTRVDAIEELKALVETQLEYCLENDMLETVFRPAPKKYWDKFYANQQRDMISQLSSHKIPIHKLISNLEMSYA